MADSILHRQKKHSENMNPTWGTFGGPGDPTLTFGPCAAQSPHLPTTTQNLFPRRPKGQTSGTNAKLIT